MGFSPLLLLFSLCALAHSSPDFYATIGAARDASFDEIKAAYWKAVRAHHPDLNPGDMRSGEKLTELNLIYEVLSDPDKRSDYDRQHPSVEQTAERPTGFRRAQTPVSSEEAELQLSAVLLLNDSLANAPRLELIEELEKEIAHSPTVQTAFYQLIQGRSRYSEVSRVTALGALRPVASTPQVRLWLQSWATHETGRIRQLAQDLLKTQNEQDCTQYLDPDSL